MDVEKEHFGDGQSHIEFTLSGLLGTNCDGNELRCWRMQPEGAATSSALSSGSRAMSLAATSPKPFNSDRR